MPNEKNLIPIKTLTKEEAKKRGAAGGKKSGEVRRFKAELNKMLNSRVLKGQKELNEFLESLGVPEHSRTHRIAVVAAMINEAEKGNKQAADWVRDTAGEKPKDEIEHSGGVVIITGSDELAD